MNQVVVKNLHKMGSSQAIVIPKAFLDAIGARDAVTLELDGDRIVVRAHKTK